MYSNSAGWRLDLESSLASPEINFLFPFVLHSSPSYFLSIPGDSHKSCSLVAAKTIFSKINNSDLVAFISWNAYLSPFVTICITDDCSFYKSPVSTTEIFLLHIKFDFSATVVLLHVNLKEVAIAINRDGVFMTIIIFLANLILNPRYLCDI